MSVVMGLTWSRKIKCGTGSNDAMEFEYESIEQRCTRVTDYAVVIADSLRNYNIPREPSGKPKF